MKTWKTGPAVLAALIMLTLPLFGCNEEPKAAEKPVTVDDLDTPGQLTKDTVEKFKADKEKYRDITGLDEARQKEKANKEAEAKREQEKKLQPSD